MSVQVKGSGTIGGLDEGLVVSGIVTSSTQINVGSNIKLGSAGIVTATSFVGSGANLTGITGTTINNNASTKFITGSGSANTLDCEANLSYNNSLVTFSSSSLMVDKGTNPTISTKETSGNKEVQLRSNTTGGLLRTVGSYPLVLGVNQAEKLRIDSNGNVSLGLGGDAVPTSTAYNGGTLHIHQASSGSNGAQLKMTTSAGGSAAGDGFYIAHWGGNNETFIYNKEATNMRFGTNSTERLNIKNDGDLEITDGNLIVAPGHGIDFSDSSNASGMSSELLDDYEEGSWTPTINVGTFSVFVTCKYVKIGRFVKLNGGLIFNNNSSNTEVQISNIPFAGDGSQFTGTVWLRRTSTGDKKYIATIGQSGNSTISYQHDSNGNDMGGAVFYSNFQHSSTYNNFSISYFTNA